MPGCFSNLYVLDLDFLLIVQCQCRINACRLQGGNGNCHHRYENCQDGCRQEKQRFERGAGFAVQARYIYRIHDRTGFQIFRHLLGKTARKVFITSFIANFILIQAILSPAHPILHLYSYILRIYRFRFLSLTASTSQQTVHIPPGQSPASLPL